MTKRTTSATETRTAILEAALHCFGELGFDATSIRMVAERAGRPLSLIGHHFGGKEGLYIETLKNLFQNSELHELTEKEPDPQPKGQAEAIRQFREAIHLLYTVTSRPAFHPDPAREAGRRLLLRELHAPRPEVKVMIKDLLSPWKEQIWACIHFLRPDLRETEIAFLGSTILGQAIVQGLAPGLSESVWGPNHLSEFKSAEMITEFALNGLGVRSV
jgi:AcrR family transcriptional regulator